MIFLSYARSERRLASKLADTLKKLGQKVWLDIDELKPGQFWKQAIVRAIEESEAILFLLPKENKKNVSLDAEMAIALSYGKAKRIVPIVQSENAKVPFSLQKFQYFNLYLFENLEKAARKIVESINSTHFSGKDIDFRFNVDSQNKILKAERDLIAKVESQYIENQKRKSFSINKNTIFLTVLIICAFFLGFFSDIFLIRIKSLFLVLGDSFIAVVDSASEIANSLLLLVSGLIGYYLGRLSNSNDSDVRAKGIEND